MASWPHFAGFEATLLVVSVTPSRVQAGRIHVAVRRKNASSSLTTLGTVVFVLTAPSPASSQLPRIITQFGWQKFFCRWTTSLEQSTQQSSTLWQLDMDFGQVTQLQKTFSFVWDCGALWHFVIWCTAYKFIYLLLFPALHAPCFPSSASLPCLFFFSLSLPYPPHPLP